MELNRANGSMDIVIRRGKIYPAMLLASSATLFQRNFHFIMFPPSFLLSFFPPSLSIYIYISFYFSIIRSSLYSWTARRMDDQFPCSTSLATSFNALPRNEKKIYVTYNWYRRSPLWLEKLSSDTAFPFEIRRNYNYKRALDRSFSLSLSACLSPPPLLFRHSLGVKNK